jgi:hypothetical protein
MHFMSDIKIAVHKLIFGKGGGKRQFDIYELAEHVNRSYNYLTKIADPTKDHPTPVELLVPIMKLKHNFRPLEMMCWECGGVFVRLPKPAMSKGDELDMAAGYSVLASEVSALVTKAFKNPTNENLTECLAKLKTMTSESVSVHKYVEKKASKQFSLEFVNDGC